jgi:hypothetical protein
MPTAHMPSPRCCYGSRCQVYTRAGLIGRAVLVAEVLASSGLGTIPAAAPRSQPSTERGAGPARLRRLGAAPMSMRGRPRGWPANLRNWLHGQAGGRSVHPG